MKRSHHHIVMLLVQIKKKRQPVKNVMKKNTSKTKYLCTTLTVTSHERKILDKMRKDHHTLVESDTIYSLCKCYVIMLCKEYVLGI